MKNLIYPILGFGAILLAYSSCKPAEPVANICPELPLVITTQDTLVLENCSLNSNTQRWELPNSATSSQTSVAFYSSTPGVFEVKLYVSNDDYANDYEATREITVELP